MKKSRYTEEQIIGFIKQGDFSSNGTNSHSVTSSAGANVDQLMISLAPSAGPCCRRLALATWWCHDATSMSCQNCLIWLEGHPTWPRSSALRT